MAIVSSSAFDFGFRGRVGETVYRRVGDLTVAAKRPGKARFTTAAQTATRSKFQHAARYAKTQMENAAVKELYRSRVNDKNRTPYLVAVADYMSSPLIHSINTYSYTGDANQQIRITASDNFKVETVKVRIVNGSGDVIEEGFASKRELGCDEWVYVTGTSNMLAGGGEAVVEVKDLAGNITKQSLNLPQNSKMKRIKPRMNRDGIQSSRLASKLLRTRLPRVKTSSPITRTKSSAYYRLYKPRSPTLKICLADLN
ncbi:MAG: hypothetical protein ABIS36_02040 [Chryseolinea sp.]